MLELLWTARHSFFSSFSKPWHGYHTDFFHITNFWILLEMRPAPAPHSTSPFHPLWTWALRCIEKHGQTLAFLGLLRLCPCAHSTENYGILCTPPLWHIPPAQKSHQEICSLQSMPEIFVGQLCPAAQSLPPIKARACLDQEWWGSNDHGLDIIIIIYSHLTCLPD